MKSIEKEKKKVCVHSSEAKGAEESAACLKKKKKVEPSLVELLGFTFPSCG